MSDLSSLAKAFKQNSTQQANAISESVQNEFRQHEKRLQQALEQSASTTEAAILAQNRRLSRLVLKGWIWLLLTILLIGLMSGGLMWWTGQRITANLAMIDQQNHTLDELSSKGGQIQLSHCGKQSRLCVAVETKQSYGDGQTTYMIVKPR
jgi:hypothetical protein